MMIKVNDIKKELLKLKDDKYKNFQKSLIPGINNIIGVRIPDIRELSKKVENKIDYIENYTCEYLEEYLLKGMLISNINDVDEVLYYLDKFIKEIDNWEVCDITVSSLKIVKSNKEKIWEFINKYKNSKKEYELRFILVIVLTYFICDEYVDEIFNLLKKINSEYYYVNMAEGWLISMLYISYKEKTDCFLKNICNNKVKKIAIRKILESNRLTKEEKNIVRNTYSL